jgi:hypothetical protein
MVGNDQLTNLTLSLLPFALYIFWIIYRKGSESMKE